MSYSVPRLETWEAKQAGVACVIVEVATKPVYFPASCDASRMVFSRVPPGRTDIIPLLVFFPVAMAVEALNESRVQRVLLVRPAVEAGEKLGFLRDWINAGGFAPDLRTTLVELHKSL